MSAKWTLDIAAMQEEFFEDTALIGIVSALPVYRFCWLLNQQMGMSFTRESELDICLQKNGSKQHYFPIYQYSLPLSGCRNLLYKLKSDKEALLPEVKQLDYLWMIQSPTAEEQAETYMNRLRSIADVQLAQILHTDKLKHLDHLLV
jgi:hypothetical protein